MDDLRSLHPKLARLVGTEIGDRYAIERLLGAGGNGCVFLARDQIYGAPVAIKVLHPTLSLNPEIAARFDREIRVSRQLAHFHLVTVTDFGTTPEGLKFMVMPYLPGAELTALLDRPMPWRDATAAMMQILRGLEHAHAAGFVHRDLKPENVLIANDEHGRMILKITDFGIAKIVAGEGASEALTQAGRVTGSPEYMSPEQAYGAGVDGRADLYCAGLIYFEMLTGRRAFDHEDPFELMRMQVRQAPPPIGEHVPAVVSHIVHKLLEKDPERRFPDASSVIAALAGIDADRAPALGERRGWLSDVFRWLSRRRPASAPHMAAFGAS